MAIEFLNTNFKPYFEQDYENQDSSYILDPNFNEFSYFGKDNLLDQNPNKQITYEDLLDWAKQLSDSQDNYSDTEDDTYIPIDNLDVIESDNLNPETQTSKPNLTVGNFNISAALSRLHYLTNYVLKSPDPKTWTKKGTSDVGHYCARAVRMAMEAGGLSTKGRPEYGGDYGDFLLKNGWKLIDGSTSFKPGDICVSHGIGRRNKQGHYMGHISMYDGSKWVSDYVQNSWKQFNNAKQGVNTFFYRYNG